MTDDPVQLEAMLLDYVEGNLGDAEQGEFEAYLDAHPDVRVVLRRLMVDSEAMRSLPRAAAPVDLSEAYRGQIERDLLLGDAGAAPRSRGRFNAPLAAIAAMLMISLGMSGVAYWLLAKRPTPFVDYAMRDGGEGERDAVEPATAPQVAAKASLPDAITFRQETDGQGLRQREGSAAAADMLPSVASPTLTLNAPAAAPKLELSDAAVPADVTAAIADQRSARRRNIVYVVRADAAADASIAEREVDEAIVASRPPRDAPRGLAAASPDTVGAMARDERPILSNSAQPNATADAVAAEASRAGGDAQRSFGERVRVVRGISEREAASLQAQLRSRSAVAAIDGYDIAPDELAAAATTAPAVVAVPAQEMQQTSGLMVPRGPSDVLADGGESGIVDVFVVVRPAGGPATRPVVEGLPTTLPTTTAPSTTQPATTRAAGSD